MTSAIRTFLSCMIALCSMSAARAQCETWSTEFGGPGFGGTTYALKKFDDGSGPMLWVGGDISTPGHGLVEISRWNGHDWVYTGSLNDTVMSLCMFDDGTGPAMYAGGYFTFFPSSSGRIASWTGTSWVPVGGGVGGIGTTDAWVNTIASLDSGSGPELYVGGAFTSAGAVVANNLARWNGSYWSPVGGGVTGEVFTLQTFDDGTGPALFVGGLFSSVGGVPASGIARWDGVHWSAVGDGAHLCSSLVLFDDGAGAALYGAASFFNTDGVIARWNGLNWVPLPHPLHLSPYRLFAFDDGNGPALYSGGYGYHIGPASNGIAKWDGHTWTAFGAGISGTTLAIVQALESFPSDSGTGADLIVGGSFTTAGAVPSIGLARWNTCHDRIDSVCLGDHTLALCPCSNQGQPGHGCNNSSGTGGALLSATGTPSSDNLVLSSAFELPHSLSIFLQGSAVTPFVQSFGDGLLCTGGITLRLYTKTASWGTATAPQSGDPSILTRSSTLGDPLLPGAIRYYQVYYRDPITGYCPGGGSFNISNGLRIAW